MPFSIAIVSLVSVLCVFGAPVAITWMVLNARRKAVGASAEEFEALIVDRPAKAAVGQGGAQQGRIGEANAKGVGGAQSVVKKREKRVAKGHFQTSQNRAVPSVEKNRISARPMRFSTGT